MDGSTADLLRRSAMRMEVNPDHSEAVILMHDGSKLCFCHRVGERWAKTTPRDDASTAVADEILGCIAMFRLNRKHLDIAFRDGSRWEKVLHQPAGED
jgi:hypothetical protein